MPLPDALGTRERLPIPSRSATRHDLRASPLMLISLHHRVWSWPSTTNGVGSPNAILTPVEPPDSPDASSKRDCRCGAGVDGEILRDCCITRTDSIFSDRYRHCAGRACRNCIASNAMPEPVNAPRVPPVTVISEAVKPVMSISLAMSDVNRFACSDVGVGGGEREFGLTCD